ncbi:MAG: protein kinase [Pseudomonadota bacterium]|nr:protein kinase [Pseudomonadota bacterium]
MQPERWQRIKEIFAAALERAAADRPQYLQQACGQDAELHSEVASLLQAHDKVGGFIEQPAFERAGLQPAGDLFEWRGRRLGNYRIVSEIGRGGMSHVYKALRDDDQYHKEVAIKLLRPDLDTHSLLQRLREERQILAELSHPNIAQLLDGGVTETNAPYLVMEYIEGCPIDMHCEDRALSVRARLELMRTLCGAVHYVHQHLMVHADLKTNNILVTHDGVVKLLDFGIAKLLHTRAASEHAETNASRVIALTPAYASPEQVRGEPITTASDVYSLGVLLYRLLTGTLPFEVPAELFGWAAAAEFCERQPRPPSDAAARGSEGYRHLARELRGDLDAIVMKALSKTPEERYGSAEQLSEDLRRYLRRFPVQARPDRPMYRLQKLVQRHRAATVASSLFAVALSGGIVATSWQAHVARTERTRAERHLGEIRKLTNTYLRDVYDAAVNLPGATAIRKLLVENSLKHISALEGEAQGSLEFQRELAWAYQKFGDVQGDYLGANLGDTEGAVLSYRRALRLRQAIAEQTGSMQDQVELLRSHIAVSELLSAQSELDEAIVHANAAVEIGDRLITLPGASDAERRQRAAAHMVMGTTVNTIDLPRALESLQSARETFESLARKDPGAPESLRNLLLVYSRIAYSYRLAGRAGEALPYYLQALEYAEAYAKTDPLDAAALRSSAFALVSVGEAHNRVGNPDAALQVLGSALERLERLQQADPANVQAPLAVAYVLNQLGDSYLLKGQPAAALAHLDRATQLIAQAPPAKPTDISEVRLLAGTNAVRVGHAHALLAAQPALQPARQRLHRRDATVALERGVTALRQLTTDPLIGKEATALTRQAKQLLQDHG